MVRAVCEGGIVDVMGESWVKVRVLVGEKRGLERRVV